MDINRVQERKLSAGAGMRSNKVSVYLLYLTLLYISFHATLQNKSDIIGKLLTGEALLQDRCNTLLSYAGILVFCV